jgi:alpha-glucosidase
MTNNMNISFAESDDPQARQTNETVYMEYSRDPVRTPFQWDDTEWAGFSNTTGKTWLPIHKDYMTVNLKAQKAATKSTFKLYQSLIELRKKNHVLQLGGYEAKAVSENVFAFIRTLKAHNTVAVFVNLGGATTVSLKDLLDAKEFSDKTKAKILIVNNNSTMEVGKMVDDVQKITLGAYDAVILEVSSASKLAISMLLIVCSLIKFLF